jgi:hypothetical protein
MAAGWPTKVTYANGDVYSASDVNDTNGTLNYIDPTSATDGQVLTRDNASAGKVKWATASSGAPYVAGKNGWINGGMDVWQRGTTSASITSSLVYTADRWVGLAGASTATVVSRQLTNDTTNLPTVEYCARVQRTLAQTGTSLIQFAQSMESLNAFRFAGQSVTLSFYARAGANYSSASNALNVLMLTGTGTDQQVLVGYTGSVSAINSFATLTTTWQRFTFTATLATNTNEIGVDFYYTPVGVAGVNDYFEITGVQIEQGAVSTFSRSAPNYGGELAACQRYYMRLSSGGTSAGYGLGYAYATTSVANQLRNPVTMRTTPTVLDYAVIELTIVGAGNFPITALAIDAGTSGPDYVTLLATGASGLTTFRPYSLKNASSATGYIGLSAEL